MPSSPEPHRGSGPLWSKPIAIATIEWSRPRDSVKPSSDADVLAVPGDIGERKTAERVISEGLARFGRIDTLINNAGIFIVKPFTQYTQADYAAVMGVNVNGFFHITQLAIAQMEKQGNGHVVQVTTTLVDHANSLVPSVLASLTKGGLTPQRKRLPSNTPSVAFG